MRKFLLLILCCVSAARCISGPPSFCSANRFTDVALFDSSDIRIDSNKVYAVSKNYFSGANDTLLMDVYYPDTLADTMTARPFILLIHGGAFIAGSRHDMDYQCMEFARRGFVTATISYRLGWNCGGTDFLSICLLCGNLYANIKTATYEAAQDGRAAMRFIDANRTHYKIDNQNYFIGGTSAGSITAMHTVFWDQQEADTFCPWATAQVGLLDTAGNALPNNYLIKGVIDNCGGVTKDSILLNNGNVPLISFHDEGDCIVPNQYGQVISCACQAFYYVAGSSIVHNLLAANGICTSMNLVPLSINHCSFPEYELVNRASCFIRSVLCDSCQTSYNNTPYTAQHCGYSNGIREYSSLEQVNVHPVPANEEIQITGFISYEAYAVSIYDLSGQNLMCRKFSGENFQKISVKNLSNGIYLLKINSGESFVTKKLVIAR